MPKGDPYSRLYHRFADEYPDIYEDDAAFALWTRLLRLADMAWPAAAALPYGTKRRGLALLIECEVIRMESATTYRVRGMDKERQQRSDAGRNAVEHRWKYQRDTASNTPGNTNGTTRGNTESIPSKAETRQVGVERASMAYGLVDPGDPSGHRSPVR